jgi:hypothetical protein
VALRMLFDYLVVGQVLAGNPAAAVRGPRLVIRSGKTPVFEDTEAGALLGGIAGDGLADRRDKALLAVMLYSFARVGAIVAAAGARLREPAPPGLPGATRERRPAPPGARSTAARLKRSTPTSKRPASGRRRRRPPSTTRSLWSVGAAGLLMACSYGQLLICHSRVV